MSNQMRNIMIPAQVGGKVKIIPFILMVISLWAFTGCEEKFPQPDDALLEAAARSDLIEVKNLLEIGADVNAKDKSGITALMFASADGNKDLAALLLAKGADVDAKNNNGETALDLTGYEDIKALLRQYGHSTAPADLIYAARIGDLPTVKNYLAQGVDVNTRGSEGLTALIDAAQEGKQDVVVLLLSRSADINAKTDYGLTALIGASRYGHLEIVELLLSKGAKVNIKDNYGNTALSVATDQGYRDIVKLLLKNGGHE
jgi:ankyrin repeat protein